MKKKTIAALVATLAINTLGSIGLLGVWGCYPEPLRDCSLLNCSDPNARGTAADRAACCPQSPQSDGGTVDQPDADPPKPQTCDEQVACPKDQACNQQGSCAEAACKGAPSVNDVYGRATGTLGNPPCGCPNDRSWCQEGQAPGPKGSEDRNRCYQTLELRLWRDGDPGDPARVDRQQLFCLKQLQ